jgi:hypothetical protein
MRLSRSRRRYLGRRRETNLVRDLPRRADATRVLLLLLLLGVLWVLGRGQPPWRCGRSGGRIVVARHPWPLHGPPLAGHELSRQFLQPPALDVDGRVVWQHEPPRHPLVPPACVHTHASRVSRSRAGAGERGAGLPHALGFPAVVVHIVAGHVALRVCGRCRAHLQDLCMRTAAAISWPARVPRRRGAASYPRLVQRRLEKAVHKRARRQRRLRRRGHSYDVISRFFRHGAVRAVDMDKAGSNGAGPSRAAHPGAGRLDSPPVRSV